MKQFTRYVFIALLIVINGCGGLSKADAEKYLKEKISFPLFIEGVIEIKTGDLVLSNEQAKRLYNQQERYATSGIIKHEIIPVKRMAMYGFSGKPIYVNNGKYSASYVNNNEKWILEREISMGGYFGYANQIYQTENKKVLCGEAEFVKVKNISFNDAGSMAEIDYVLNYKSTPFNNAAKYSNFFDDVVLKDGENIVKLFAMNTGKQWTLVKFKN